MSIKLFYSKEKTNSYRPVPWHWSEDPFPAYRGKGHRYTAFQAVSKNYSPTLESDSVEKLLKDGYKCPRLVNDISNSKIIFTKKKKTRIVVPCPSDEDENIMLVTLRGGFRGGYGRIVSSGVKVFDKKGRYAHCVETHHIVAVAEREDAFLAAETGRRCSRGIVEIFHWSEGYKTMTSDEFNAYIDINNINVDRV